MCHYASCIMCHESLCEIVFIIDAHQNGTEMTILSRHS